MLAPRAGVEGIGKMSHFTKWGVDDNGEENWQYHEKYRKSVGLGILCACPKGLGAVLRDQLWEKSFFFLSSYVLTKLQILI